MSNTVSTFDPERVRWTADAASLYAANGERKYLNAAERRRALAAMEELPIDKALFAMMLAWTGARVSEILAVMPISLQLEPSVVAILTLKRRRHVVREVPIPPALMAALEQHFTIREKQRRPDTARQRLWRFSRVTAWRLIKAVMAEADVAGRQACPRGLRHAFGVGTLQANVPITLTKTWLGHSRLGSTEIYLAACGPDQLVFADRYWRAQDLAEHPSDQQATTLAPLRR